MVHVLAHAAVGPGPAFAGAAEMARDTRYTVDSDEVCAPWLKCSVLRTFSAWMKCSVLRTFLHSLFRFYRCTCL